MTDIVTRLRNPSCYCRDHCADMLEGADEIERLRLLKAGHEASAAADRTCLNKEIERLRADNARLRRELAMLSAAGGVVIGGPPGGAAMVKLP